MKVVSLNVGLPKEIQVGNKTVKTGIYKEPVAGHIDVKGCNLVGDGQADLRVHGGEFKAIYSYASEFYPLWHKELKKELPYGMFGENLTTEGIEETEISLGDHFQVGNTILEAVQPRMPCFKLGIRFEDNSIIKQFTKSCRWGIYYRVIEEGKIQVGDEIKQVKEDNADLKIYDILKAYYDKNAIDLRQKFIEHPSLPGNWKSKFS